MKTQPTAVPAYPAPRVEGATGDTVQPDQDDVTVVVPAQPGLVKDDKVIVVLDNGSAPPREEEFTAHADTDIRLYLRPEYLSGNDGRDIATRYVVTGKGESAMYTFHVGSSLELPAPEVPEAINGVIPADVVSATFRVPAAARLPVGTQVTAYFDARIGEGTVATGPVDIPIPEAAIAAARGAIVTLFYKTKGPNESRVSPELSIAVAESDTETGIAFQIETFDMPFLDVKPGETMQFRLFRLENTTYYPIKRATSPRPPFSVAYLEPFGGGRFKIILNRPSKHVRLQAGAAQAQSITAYSEDGTLLKTFDEITGWFDICDPDGRLIAYLLFNSDWFYRCDNFFIDTDHAWRQRAMPYTDTFDSLPVGNHGQFKSLPGWDLRAGGGHLSVEPAPPGLSGHVIAAHDAVGGVDHDISPRVAIHASKSIAVKMAASATTSTSLYVGFVDYVNGEQRVVATPASLTSASTTITLSGADQVCRPTEYVAFIGATTTANVTIYYDEVSFE